MSGEEAAGKDMLSPAGTTRASIPLGGVGDSTDTGQEGTGVLIHQLLSADG